MPTKDGLSGVIVNCLSDGEWHPITEVMSAAARTIPPGRAVREVEANRVGMAATRGRQAQPRSRGLTTDAMVRSGQWSLAQKSMWMMASRGTIELSEPIRRGIWRDPSVRVRWADAGLLSITEMAEMVGRSPSSLLNHIRDHREDVPEIVDRPQGMRTPASTVEQWATYLARCGVLARSPQRLHWVPLNATQDALWNPGAGDWELVNGERVVRPAVLSERTRTPNGHPVGSALAGH